MKGEQVGTDAQGNRYFRAKKTAPGARERRWVIYNGPNDASRVPAEWHGWLHGSFDELPESHLTPPKIWEAD
jgi:NADH:ubiquinone oxidoreductase subunit